MAVTRRRARLVACAALVLAALTGCGSVEPVDNPTPTFSYTPPSPLPTNTLDDQGRALPGFVTTSEELPPAQPAPAGILAATGPGWSLQTYRPQVAPVVTVSGVTTGFAAAVQVVYLVSPEGQRYQLLELDPSTPIVIDSWTAGQSVAYITQCEPLDCDPAAPTMLLDLLTGDISAVDGIASGLHVGATVSGDIRWWQDGSASATLDRAGELTEYRQAWTAVSASPSGRYLAVMRADSPSAYVSSGMAIVDLSSGLATDIKALWTEPLECEPFRWRTDDALDVSCYDPQAELWRVFAVGPGAKEMKENKSATATPPADGPWVEPDFFVADGTWAGPYTADADERLQPQADAIGLARNAHFEPLQVPDAKVGSARIVAVSGGVVFVEATQAANLSLTTAWAYDVAKDQWTQIGPLPPAGPTRGLLASEGSPAEGMTSWSVAP